MKSLNQQKPKQIGQRTDLLKSVNHSPILKFISLILVITMLNLISGCMNYFKVRQSTKPVEEEIISFQDQNKTFVIHFEDQAWILEEPKLFEDQLRGVVLKSYKSFLKKPVNPDKANRYLKNKTTNQLHILNEVHLYITDLNRLTVLNVSIPLSSVQKIEIYERDKAATIASYTIGTIAVVASGFAILIAIAALMKSSCPFIYVFDGENYQLTGEIYSGCVLPNLERHDFLKLPSVNTGSTNYQLKISNEVKEIQHTNLMELWVFDHSVDKEIGVDKYGTVHTISDLVSPAKVENLDGTDVKELVVNKDSLYYTTMDINDKRPLTDGLILEFPNTRSSDEAKLSIRAKNSFILDYMSGQYYSEFGDLYKKWNRRLKRAPAHLIQDWTNSQNIPLSLSVEKEGIWEKIDYYNIAGPIAFKDDILSIPLDGSESNPLKVKLEFGNFFWEIDHIALDYSENIEINYQVVPIKTAIDQNGKDVRKKMKLDDRRYYVQPKVGDMAIVDFELPPFIGTKTRTVFLHSKGWYEILRNPSGEPDQELVEKFREPGQLNRYINDYVERLTSK